jgi:hypothetical protein
LPFGAALTHVAALPHGAHRDLFDPYAEKKRPWGWYVAIVIIVLLALGWVFGRFDRPLSSISPKITSSWVLHNQPPPNLEGGAPESTPKAGQKK